MYEAEPSAQPTGGRRGKTYRFRQEWARWSELLARPIGELAERPQSGPVSEAMTGC